MKISAKHFTQTKQPPRLNLAHASGVALEMPPMTKKTVSAIMRRDADKDRFVQALRMLELFETHHGRQAHTVDELAEFIAGEVAAGRLTAGAY